MNKFSNRRMETVVYVSVWGLILCMYVIEGLQFRAGRGLPLITVRSALGMLANLLPFALLFLLNNHVLIPRLLMRKRLRDYALSVSGAVLLIWAWQFMEFHYFRRALDPVGIHALPPPAAEHELIPMPLLIDLSYALLVVGINVAVAMVFRLYNSVLERENILRTAAQSELAYLKAQINPHFYLNMLNNIHALIELDPEGAQRMVMGMSKLMHYMVYDSSRELSPLAAEVEFMRNYVDLMSQRYPADKVEVRALFPTEAECEGISVPPLLFLVFIENAFKHGVTYRQKSVIDISLRLEGDWLAFSCSNPLKSNSSESAPGVGLSNISQRLKLLYGADTAPVIAEREGFYFITLNLPLTHDPAYLTH